MGRGEERIFGFMFFLFGLCVVTFLGRMPGILVGGLLCGFSFAMTRRGTMRVALQALLCFVGLVITVHAGATPDWIAGDLSELVPAAGGMEIFELSGPRLDLRVGFGLVGAGICGLVVAMVCGPVDDDPW